MSLPWKQKLKLKTGRWLGRLAVGCCLTAALSGCYVAKLAYHHTNLYSSRRPIAAVMADPATPPAARAQLAAAEEVMAYAQAEGLNTADAYRYYIAIEGEAVSYLVQAAHADRLEAITWWFPIVGRVPYRGYFSPAERDEEARQLADAGYDTATGNVAAFSSLGWFEDPLYSTMLERPADSLAALLLHELAHRSCWLEDQADFNENLATFVELTLTPRYLESKQDFVGLERYKNRLRDKALYKDWLSALKTSLEDLYRKPPAGGKKRLLEAKAAIFTRFTRDERPPFTTVDYIGKRPWNNATVLGASLYSPELSRFNAAYRCYRGRPMGDFLKAVKAAWQANDKHEEDPFAALETLCKAS